MGRLRMKGIALAGLLLAARAGAAVTPAPTSGPAATPTPTPTPTPTGMAVAAVAKVTWQQAMERALARNPSMIVASQEIERASALVREARAAWLPSLTGNGSYLRLDSPRMSGVVTTLPPNTWNGNLAVTVPLVAPLGWVNESHARDNRETARASADDTRRQLATAVGRAYLAVVLQHRQVDVVSRARETALAHYDYAHTRLAMGLANAVDDARAEQELRANEAQLQNAQTALVRVQSALAILLSEEDLVDAVDDVALAGAPTPDDALAQARSRRADVRAAEARRAATQNLRHDDWAYYAPSLLAQAQAFRQTQTPIQPGSGWQASLVLSIPLFDGGFRGGVQRERQAADEEARALLEGLLRQVGVEVRAAVAIVRNADESLRAARAAAGAALTAATLADRSYRAGATTNIEVIDAERQARDAESQVALAEDAARQARLDLLLATGAFP